MFYAIKVSFFIIEGILHCIRDTVGVYLEKEEEDNEKNIPTDGKEVLDRVKSRESGLTDEEVKRSREACGWNELTEGKKKSILQIFGEQYKDFLVLILIASAVISGILGDVESAAVIMIVITMNAVLGNCADGKKRNSPCRA